MWRLLGVKIGRRVFDDGCSIPEKTLVTIGDDCMLNAGSVVQCHSMEDGVFKSDRTVIGAGCTLGVESFVHYGVTMGDGSVLEADAFLMKGEEVAPGARWRGNPADEIRDTPALLRATAPASPRLLGAALVVPSALDELRAYHDIELPGMARVELSLFSLERCRQREEELAGVLAASERDEAATFKSSARRSEYIASRALVRLMLSADWRPGVASHEWRIGRSERGKMTVTAPGADGLDVSISHSDAVLAVVVSDAQDVGVDVEATDGDVDGGVTSSVLSPTEQARLVATPAAERRRVFIRMWTLKEAFAKCTGAGVAEGFDGLETELDPPAVVGDGARPASFHQRDWDSGEGTHAVAVAASRRSV
jgi:phosphopantetheinyl transferase